MAKFILPYFGEIDLDNIEEYYNEEISYKDSIVRLDLNIEESSIKESIAVQMKNVLNNFEAYDLKNREYIDADYAKEEDGQALEFASFHLEEIGEEISEEIGIDLQAEDKNIQFIKKLKLVRIGMYPDGKYGSTSFAVFDYCIDQNISDQLLVVKVDALGNLLNIAWES